MPSNEKLWTTELVAEFDQSEDCIKLISLDGSILWVNANGRCAMEIDDIATIENRQWTDLWPEETRATIRSGMVKAATGQAVEINALCPTMKGNERHWNVSISQVGDVGGNPVGYLAISRDITNG